MANKPKWRLFFKATDGKTTVFRGSEAFVFIACHIQYADWTGLHKQAARAGWFPAVQISKEEFNDLLALRDATRVDPGHGPENQWVRNSDILPAKKD